MKDNVKPGEKWEFNDEVARCFKNMLERSIPDYQSMRALSYELGTRFVKPDTLIVDAGCSTGMAVEPFVERFKDANDFLLIDNSPAMAAASKERFSKYPGVEVRAGNLWENLPLKDTASLVLSVLSLQFMPTAYRQTMISAIYESLAPGGAFIFVEKIVSENMDDLMVELYYDISVSAVKLFFGSFAKSQQKDGD